MTAGKHLIDHILELKSRKRALILCHNYQRLEIQEVSDEIGDSLELCMAAKGSEGYREIIFCGVDFMAESASVLNPDKKVLIPDRSAVCDMASMLSREQVVEAKSRHPDAAVVLYVNSLAEAKAEADVICTSANAAEIVSKVDEETVLFGPDRNLASWVDRQVAGKRIIPLPDDGCCYVHRMITTDHILEARRRHPDAELLVHPECDPEVVDLADYVVSTGGMVRRGRESDSDGFIIGTEANMVGTLARQFPDKRFYPLLPKALCRGMQAIDLEKVERSLVKDVYEVEVEPGIADRVRKVTERMLQMTG